MKLGCCAIALLAACYAPTVPGGAPCDPAASNCPEGQTCQASAGGNVCSAGEPDRGPIVDGAVGSFCLGGKLLGNLCVATKPTAAVTLSATVITSSTMPGNCTEIRTLTTGGSLCLVVGDSITIASAATVRVLGPNPIVLFAGHDVSIQGTLDGSSHAGETLGGAPVTGPGARTAAECGALGTDGTGGSNDNGGGGGAGGSFSTQGAAGGNGKNNVPHGNPAAINTPISLVGGCPGGHGGDGQGGGGGGAGGSGGGAIYVLAGGTVTVAGKINASGGGGIAGTGGVTSGGGAGGGGAGGMIGIEAPTTTVTGAVFANGGGGGGGCGDDQNKGGKNGGDAATPTVAALGGDGGSGGGGPGGVGSTVVVAKPGTNAGGTVPQTSGGGGGGGLGVIRLYGTPTTTGATISPPATN